MTDRQRKALRITGWVFLSLFLIGLVGAGIAYSKRENLLRVALDRAIRKAKRDYNLDVTIASAQFTGLSSVAFTGISVVPQNRDSLARIDRIEVGVRLWPMLAGKVSLSAMTLENGLIQVVKRDSLTNIDFLIRRKKRDSTETQTTRRTDLSDVAENLIDNILSKVPDDLSIRNLEFRGISDTTTVSLLTESAVIDDEEVNSTIRVNGNFATWHITGTADPADREYDLALFAEGQNGQPRPLELPYIQQRYKLKLQVDTLRAKLDDVDRDGSEFRMEGAGSVRNLRINHPAVARTDVLVPSASMEANVFVGENYVGVDSSSVLRLGEVSARPFVKYTLSPTKAYELQVHTDPMDAQAVFNSFPQGLFESLEGMQVTGKLKYDLAFQLDTELPDSVRFNSALTQDGFRILKMGRTDFAAINRPFVYTPYEKGQPVRPIIVGPENPDFTPLDQIAPDLRNALLTSEDYTFFTHKGFNEKAFRVSIATNFKEKSFKRGASTVSMQLVKNAFLNRNKTLSRKVEEILIVWLIENERLIPKERMYEVYLNIIEWGRNIYGIGEAARYYFDKTPAELNLGESIFLAFVVPRPKRALDWFLPDGSLQVRNVRGYFRIIGRLMAKRGLTAPDSGAYGFYDVRLRPALRRQIAPVDSLYPSDSLLLDGMEGDIDDGEDGVGGFLRRLFKGKDDDNRRETEPTTVQPERPEPVPGEVTPTDTVKTRKQLRQERRERKRREREEQRLQEEGTLN
ncbi:transglycosylase domain-containing protein [Spirosoma montaniterrae]|uniref:Penicillin-binding protein n=1 Tax=Spirosoma montaniterrae TaxID=1178516 RepID=A0A1P9WVK7_9BACT|nr:biosynthetic peptidoglycan transglycosylase [Spirosoma montaniterrae]AQG79393.1 penicillin-binding protein [Spirosoma montaniterrae]